MNYFAPIVKTVCKDMDCVSLVSSLNITQILFLDPRHRVLTQVPIAGLILHPGWLHLRVVVQKRRPSECGHFYGRKWFHAVF